MIKRVASAAGVARFKKPIGSIITGDGSVLKNLTLVKPEHEGFDSVKDKKGNKYTIGYSSSRDKWVAVPSGATEPVEEADDEEGVFKKLDARAGEGVGDAGGGREQQQRDDGEVAGYAGDLPDEDGDGKPDKVKPMSKPKPSDVAKAKARRSQRNVRPAKKTPSAKTKVKTDAMKKVSIKGSKDGKGTPDDPIDVGDDVERAHKLLAEGKSIRMATTMGAGTLIKKLHQIVKDAESKGDQAPEYDLCKVSVPGTNLFCAEHKGIPRIKMPQLKGIAREGSVAAGLRKNPKDKESKADLEPLFVKALGDMGVGIKRKMVSASDLKASQMELKGTMVSGIAQAIRDGTLVDAPIFVTRDGYILDGHHRWAGKVAVDLDDGELGDVKMEVDMVDMDIGALIDFTNAFTTQNGIDPVGVAEKPWKGEKSRGSIAENIRMIQLGIKQSSVIDQALMILEGTRLTKTREVPIWLPNGEQVETVDQVAMLMNVDRKVAAQYIIEQKAGSIELNIEAKQARSRVQRVRTPAGEKKYKQPIGSIIVRDGVLKNVTLLTPEFTGWDLVEDKKGKKYDVGYSDRHNKWVAFNWTPEDKPNDWRPVVAADNEEDVFLALEAHLSGRKATATASARQAVAKVTGKAPAPKAPPKSRVVSSTPKAPAAKKTTPAKKVPAAPKMTVAQTLAAANVMARANQRKKPPSSTTDVGSVVLPPGYKAQRNSAAGRAGARRWTIYKPDGSYAGDIVHWPGSEGWSWQPANGPTVDVTTALEAVEAITDGGRSQQHVGRGKRPNP